MISEVWLHFGVVILVQFIFFFVCAAYYKKLDEMPTLLLRGIFIGIAIGLLYDHLLGRYLGLFSYELGFGFPFLLLNAGLSYGLFVASTLLLKKISTIHFVIWLSALVTVYEITNYFFPVWRYEFTLSLAPLFVLCLVGYSSGALLASLIAYKLFNHQFILKLSNVKN